jgi:hypothetical protein
VKWIVCVNLPANIFIKEISIIAHFSMGTDTLTGLFIKHLPPIIASCYHVLSFTFTTAGRFMVVLPGIAVIRLNPALTFTS